MPAFPPTTEELHRIAQSGWPGTQQENIGEWTVRFGHGNTRRANSALAAGDPQLPLNEALDVVAERYRSQGQPPFVMVPVELDGTAHDVDAVAEAAGWTLEAPSTHMVLDLTDFPTSTPAPDILSFAWSDEPPATMAPADTTAHAVLTASPARYVTALLGGQYLGHGRLALCGDWCGFSNLLIVEEARGRGLGRALMLEMQSEAARHNGRYGYLQVERDNTVAHHLYSHLDWMDHSHYHYRRGPVTA